MRRAYIEESDSVCFARRHSFCECLSEIHRGCGTYRCPFYKPLGCEDWLRIDDGYFVNMYMPEEFEFREYGKDK